MSSLSFVKNYSGANRHFAREPPVNYAQSSFSFHEGVFLSALTEALWLQHLRLGHIYLSNCTAVFPFIANTENLYMRSHHNY